MSTARRGRLNRRQLLAAAAILPVGGCLGLSDDENGHLDLTVQNDRDDPVMARLEVSDDWRGALAWNADTCVRFDGTVRVTEESVEVSGECVESR